MNATAGTDWAWTELDRFEADARRAAGVDLTAYLPPAVHPEYLDALTELVRLDMELAFRRGETRTPARYFARFPELADDSVAAAGVNLGARVSDEDGDANPRTVLLPASELPSSSPGTDDRRTDCPTPPTAVAPVPTTDGVTTPPPSTWPAVGQLVAGFRLTGQLGRGAFGRVYLAQQGDLAGRLVAVKVGKGLVSETRTLARLQHTNIVPVYSAHRHDPFQLVCMPYLGRTTLAHVIDRFRAAGQVMPESVRHLIDTFRPADDTTCYNHSAALPPSSAPAGEAAAGGGSAFPDAPLRGGFWDKLAGGPLVDAVVWLAAELATGLAHAHERGILHRDIKPANVLLTDDGVPMLLDFNLADDANERNEAASASVGGTLPYMAPEQMAAFHNPYLRADARADLYALGVVLYELLSGVRPFPERHGTLSGIVAAMSADRTRLPPTVRRWNPFARPSLEALVFKLLAPEPADRYQSATDLAEDLNRYLARLPLRHAANQCWRERARNWIARHPRVVSSGTVGGVVGVIAVLSVGSGLVVRERARTLEARVALGDHTRELSGLQALLDDRGLGRPQLDDALGRCEQNLARYGLTPTADTPPAVWDRHLLVRYLPADDRDRLRGQVAELYFLLGRAAFQRAKMADDATGRTAALADAERWNQQAEAFGGATLIRAVREQRADLLRMAGRTADADRLAESAATAPPGSPRDRFLLGFWWYQRGLLHRALPELTTATADDPQNFSAWFVLGTTHLNLEHPDLAAMCFTACVALRADFAPARLNRGLAFLRLGKPQLAIDDLDVAIRLDPTRAELHFLRAGALAQLGNHREAERGYTDALDCPDCPPRVYLYRATERDAQRDEAGARADRAEAERREPTDALGWVARAENADADPPLALRYVDRALELSPLDVNALQLKAHLLSERLDRPADALKVLDRALEHHPENVPCLAGRAVSRARGKDRGGAVADAQAALRLSAGGLTLYQAACVYALTSRVEPADRFKAMELLHAALKAGFGKEHLADDPDLDPLRESAEFQALLKAHAPRKPAD